MIRTSVPRVLVIVGPTGVGKTRFAVRVGEAVGAHVVSEDSRQAYRFMDIGTAKPSLREQAAVPHHGLDLVAPSESWTLAQQQRLTYSTLDLLRSSGIPAMLVGGTGQYIRAALEGWSVPEVPPDPALRALLGARAAADGAAVLHEELRAVDPHAAEGIMPGDVRRMVRALEVWTSTGRLPSELRTSQPPPYQFRVVGLTRERAALYRGVDERVDRMVREGLLDEVRRLLDAGYAWEQPPMRSIGYGELEPYFVRGEPLKSCLERMKYNTHGLIRRQYIWFRRLGDVRWLDAADGASCGAAARELAHWLSSA